MCLLLPIKLNITGYQKYFKYRYLIIPISTAYVPNPITGGTARANANSQIICTYLEVMKVTWVGECHDRSCHMIDVNRIAAIAVRVYKELIP